MIRDFNDFARYKYNARTAIIFSADFEKIRKKV